LTLHQKDFNIDAEWHFFATNHGKGPSDGVGGTLKREASRESLRRPLNNQILTARDLYDFAALKLPNMAFGFATQRLYNDELSGMAEVIASARTITGTQRLHAFIPAGVEGKLMVREFSASAAPRVERVLALRATPVIAMANLVGYSTVRYDQAWWVAVVVEPLPATEEVRVNFLHPHGPAASFVFPEIADQLVIGVDAVLTSVAPTTSTGRTYSLSRREQTLASNALN
jgi:hypothetical protein